MTEPGISTAVLMCHAPIVLPEIARDERETIRQSTEAMEEAARSLLAHRPDVIVVVSPHTPRHRSHFGLVGGARLEGDFGDFGFSEVTISLPNAADAGALITARAHSRGVPLSPLPSLSLDHGAMVPLYFVQRAGWQGPTALLSLPYAPTRAQCEELGSAIAEAARQSGKRWALLASGDMSHRLKPGAPAGFHPAAQEFDRFIADQVTRGDYAKALSVDAELRELAAEDVVDTLAVAAGAVDHLSCGHRTHSYEGPFGVGYLVATLFDSKERA